MVTLSLLLRTGDHQSAKFVALDPLPSGYVQRDPKHQSAKCVALDSLPSGFDQRDPKKPKKQKKTKKQKKQPYKDESRLES